MKDKDIVLYILFAIAFIGGYLVLSGQVKTFSKLSKDQAMIVLVFGLVFVIFLVINNKEDFTRINPSPNPEDCKRSKECERPINAPRNFKGTLCKIDGELGYCSDSYTCCKNPGV